MPVEKQLLLDLTRELGVLEAPGKLEGLTLLDGKTLALGFDNDYGFEGDAAEIYPVAELRSRTLIITLPIVLPPPIKPQRAEARPAARGDGRASE